MKPYTIITIVILSFLCGYMSNWCTSPTVSLFTDKADGELTGRPARERAIQQLSSVIIPDVAFSNITPKDAICYVEEMIKGYDIFPGAYIVRPIMSSGSELSLTFFRRDSISVHSENCSLFELIKLIVDKSGLAFGISEDGTLVFSDKINGWPSWKNITLIVPVSEP